MSQRRGEGKRPRNARAPPRLTRRRGPGTMRILIADDHEVIRHGIRNILETRPQWQICGEAMDGRIAVRLARELLPDAVIMDIVMPTMNGLQATERLIQEGCTSPVLIL